MIVLPVLSLSYPEEGIRATSVLSERTEDDFELYILYEVKGNWHWNLNISLLKARMSSCSTNVAVFYQFEHKGSCVQIDAVLNQLYYTAGVHAGFLF